MMEVYKHSEEMPREKVSGRDYLIFLAICFFAVVGFIFMCIDAAKLAGFINEMF